MPNPAALATNRPAETLTGLTAAVVAILVATTNISTPLATALVVVVGALPGLVTSIVSATRSTAAGTLLVSLTPQVRNLRGQRLGQEGRRPIVSPDAPLRGRRVAAQTSRARGRPPSRMRTAIRSDCLAGALTVILSTSPARNTRPSSEWRRAWRRL